MKDIEVVEDYYMDAESVAFNICYELKEGRELKEFISILLNTLCARKEFSLLEEIATEVTKHLNEDCEFSYSLIKELR